MDKLRYSKVVLEKTDYRRGRKTHNNARFREDEGRFYRKMNQTKNFTGTVPEIEKFVQSWGGIWKQKSTTKEQPWMFEIEQQLKNKIQDVERVWDDMQ